MKIYIQDYSKPSEADNLLYKAERFWAKGFYLQAKKRINQASLLLRQYLAGDNMIIDRDAIGLIKAEDYYNGGYHINVWNNYYKVWDDEDGDDSQFEASKELDWMVLEVEEDEE